MSSKVEKKDLRYMSSVSEAMLEQAPTGAKWLLWSVAFFVVLAIVWANLAELDELSRGEGEIIPSKQLQVIQNLEGGIVAEILVREGDLVEKGQVLLRIDDTRFSSSFKENKVRELELIAKAARLRAESEGVDFITPKDFPYEFEMLLRQERSLYEARKRELNANVVVFEQQLRQKQQELVQAKSKRGQLGRSYSLLKQERDMTAPLVREGVVSEVEYLRLKRQVVDLSGELNNIRLSLPRILSSLDETRGMLKEAKLKFQSIARSELNETLSESARLREALTGMQDKLRRTEVTSPVKGTIKELLFNTINGVVQPGDEILNIVPWEDTLLVEAKLRPSDIAKVKPGQKAVIKVSAYDFGIYGGVDAIVATVSPSTVTNEKDEPFYIVRLTTAQPYLEKDGVKHPLIAGMTVSVDILTGKKTVMDYLLKPILKAQQKALTER
ncbi:MAG: HlyD family type I secretion periplasmic adaptor subunit [Oceanospirillaceae bacterium]|nr:HlyD family type I secretion periplasmic adaptor subunit [Oceanospirillaceae bacterium]